jgi:hypothetical protein
MYGGRARGKTGAVTAERPGRYAGRAMRDVAVSEGAGLPQYQKISMKLM